MFKKKKGRRFLALLLAILCMATTAAPSFAMGFDDLQTVIDMTIKAVESVEARKGESDDR